MRKYDAEQIIEILKSLNRFSGLDTETLQSIASYAQVREYRHKECIVKEGEFDSRFYFLLSGIAAVIKGGEVLVTFQRKGELFGEMAIIFGEMGTIEESTRSATIMAAVSETKCLSIDASLFDSLKADAKDRILAAVYGAFSYHLATKIRSMSEEIVGLRKEIKALKSLGNK